ncbi:MAG: hypothetical protein H0T79_22085, partial [Deltaproteobacteria bacterium]|nr:hypothetical protein [Deltaproteobacteria bacterium]
VEPEYDEPEYDEPEYDDPADDPADDTDDADDPFGIELETRDLPVLASKASTRELPHVDRRPARATEPPLGAAPTRDLGLRPQRAATEEEATGQLDLQKFRNPAMAEGTKSVVLPFDPADALAAQILDDVDEGIPSTEPKDDRTRRRIQALLERAGSWNRTGECDKAVTAVDLALSEDPASTLAQKLIHRNRDTITTVFQGFLGDLQRQPMLSRPLHELSNTAISPRAAFLLSRIDGVLSLDEILDVSGMPRLEAYRYLCQLFLRGILR